ncbi:MAG: hypothetical protein JWQ71_1147 [Pedosphaera sp.]|nr:hypothetical protein [Pedosphaera sp.]
MGLFKSVKTLFATVKRFSEVRKRIPVVLLCHLLVSLAVGAGCSQKAVQPPATATANWSWDAYPKVEKMRLAILPCRILPKTSLTINAPVSGQLRLYIDRPQTNLPTDFVWAEFEPKVLNMEAAELAEAKRKIDERERLFKEIELPKERIKLNREIAEAQKQLTLLSLVATNPALAQLAISASSGNKDGILKSGSLDEARKELALMEQNLKYLSTTNPAMFGIDLEGARMEWQRRQLEFDRRQAQSRFKMPFAGQLIASVQLAEGITEYPVSAGQELAVVRDLKSVLLRVPLEDVSWSALPVARLTAILHLPDGTQLEAPFAYKKLERSQLREEVFYYFQFPFEESAPAAQLVGTDLSCELWLGLPQPARIVPKLALVLHEPTAFQNRQWNEGITRLLPGAHVVVEGQTDLAILPPVPQQNAETTGSNLSKAIPK